MASGQGSGVRPSSISFSAGREFQLIRATGKIQNTRLC